MDDSVRVLLVGGPDGAAGALERADARLTVTTPSNTRAEDGGSAAS